jgi:hypothetical protein
MSHPIRVWTCAAVDPVYASGGWASLRQVGGELTAFAGGDRRTSVSRMALAGLAAALKGLPRIGKAAPAAIEIHTPSPELARLPHRLATLRTAGGPDAPSEDLDLWAEIAAAAAGRTLSIARAIVEPRTPMAFVGAWADFARDKAKTDGAFTAPIPKSNLAKVLGLELT